MSQQHSIEQPVHRISAFMALTRLAMRQYQLTPNRNVYRLIMTMPVGPA